MRLSRVVLVWLLLALFPAFWGTGASGRRALAEEEGTAESASDPAKVERDTARARALVRRLETLYQAGRYREALATAREALAVRERALGPEHRAVASDLNNLGAVLLALGDLEQARAVLERAVQIEEKALGTEHPALASRLNGLAMVLYELDDLEGARALCERALRNSEKALGPDHPDLTATMGNLAGVLAALGDTEEALDLTRKALRINEAVLGAEHPVVATNFNNLAALHRDLGMYREALAHGRRALAIREKVLGPDHPATANSLHVVGQMLVTLGRPEEARPVLERTLRIEESTFGSEHPSVADALGKLGWVYEDLGSYGRARELYEGALHIYEKALGPEHSSVSSALADLAGVLETLGAYETARPLYERAHAIDRKVFGAEHSAVGHSLHNLARLHLLLGAYEEARLLFERAREVLEKALGRDAPEVASVLGGLAQVLVVRGDYEEALALYARALEIEEKTLGPEHPGLATHVRNLGAAYAKQGKLEKARPLFERAVALEGSALGSDHPDVAWSLNSLAYLLLQLGEHDEAVKLSERALRIYERALGPGHPSVASELHNLAQMHRRAGRPDVARQYAARALSVAEDHVRSAAAGVHAAGRLALARRVRGYLDSWLRLPPRRGRAGYPEVLRFKGLMARATAAERRLARRGDAEAIQCAEDLRVAERAVAKLSQSAPSAYPREGREERREAWQDAYASASAERERLALALARACAPFRAGLERLDISAADVRHQIADDAVLVDFLRSGDQYAAWVVKSSGHVDRVSLGSAAEIERDVDRFLEATRRLSGAGSRGPLLEQGGERVPDRDALEAAWKSAGKDLDARVFEPVEARFASGTHRVYLCPDGVLASVPFSLLPGREDGRLLIHEYVLTHLTMAQDLVPWPDAADPGKGALLLGGVDYGKAKDAGAKEPRPRAFTDRAPRGLTFSALAGTGPEVQAIEALLGDGSIDLLLGTDATEANVRAAAVGKLVLHLSTHGFVRDDLRSGLRRQDSGREWLGAASERHLAVVGHDPLNLAGLALAGANPRRGGDDDDGILTALEASHLDLRGVEIVVLSACETARGRAEAGEGAIGLVRGFKMAGARQVLGSLWKVDDAATTALMVKFYELWHPGREEVGPDAAAALRQAQLFVRNHPTRPKWEDPHYWAAWVLWGASD